MNVAVFNTGQIASGQPAAQEQMVAMEQVSQARYALYKVLGLAYLYPGDIDWTRFCSTFPEILSEAAEVLSLDLENEIAALKNILHFLDFELICCEHTMLFINNPNTKTVSPYESIYLEGTIMGNCSRKVEAQYTHYGLKIDSGHAYLLPDHIGLELDFMACLIEKDMLFEDSFFAAENRFFTNHLAKWLPHFLEEVMGRNPHTLYLLLARVTEKLFSFESDLFAIPPKDAGSEI